MTRTYAVLYYPVYYLCYSYRENARWAQRKPMSYTCRRRCTHTSTRIHVHAHIEKYPTNIDPTIRWTPYKCTRTWLVWGGIENFSNNPEARQLQDRRFEREQGLRNCQWTLPPSTSSVIDTCRYCFGSAKFFRTFLEKRNTRVRRNQNHSSTSACRICIYSFVVLHLARFILLLWR